jgi:hypothetical protein
MSDGKIMLMALLEDSSMTLSLQPRLFGAGIYLLDCKRQQQQVDERATVLRSVYFRAAFKMRLRRRAACVLLVAFE